MGTLCNSPIPPTLRHAEGLSLDFSTWSIRNPVTPILLFALLSIAGLFAFDRMKVQNLPDTDFPTVTVSASLPGAAPPLLESEVARKLEDAIAPIQGLKSC